MFHEIETARLRLRHFTNNDLDALCALFSDPEVVRYLGIEAGSIFSRQECETMLHSSIAGWQKHGFGRWAVIDKRLDKFVGLCGWRSSDGTPELLYMLAKEFWGMGLATEAAGACVRYGFEQLHFASAFAITRPEHDASRRVLEKIGMSFEGVKLHTGIEAAVYTLSKDQFRVDSAAYVLHPV
jgi:RimJ/RimL family protein N-acetyltransferase